MDGSCVQSLNAYMPTPKSPSGRMMEVKFVHPSKACWSSSVTVLGTVYEVACKHLG